MHYESIKDIHLGVNDIDLIKRKLSHAINLLAIKYNMYMAFHLYL